MVTVALALAIAYLIAIVHADVNSLFGDKGRALLPPRGWNSYDAYSWVITEEDFLENAELVSKYLRTFGYQYVVVDSLWYRKVEPGVTPNGIGNDTLDAWGRPQPDPGRWPSARRGRGFRPLADRVHQLGLKFGIKVMRGIHKMAVERNTPVFGGQGSQAQTKINARDVAVFGQDCSSMPDSFMGVNVSSQGGRLFIKSLYRQYVDWGVDFSIPSLPCTLNLQLIKLDCVFGEKDLHLDEILAASESILQLSHRPIVFSIAPGTNVNAVMAAAVANATNMFRVSQDTWDTWVDIQPKFTIARDFASSGYISGEYGYGGGHSWPDLDSLPFGWLGDPDSENVAYRSSRLTDIEQKTMMTLWAMAKSPLMFGGDMRHLDQPTLDVLTNTAVLELNANAMGNAEVIRFATGVVKVTSCGSITTAHWKVVNSSHICWKGSNSTSCLNWRRMNQTDGAFIGQAWLDNPMACLDASPNATTIDDQEHFSACENHSSQTWRLNSSGHLVGEHFNDRCAVVVEPDDSTHIWVAYGPSGEVYLAFFNASPKKTQMSIRLDDLLEEFYTTVAATGNMNNTGSTLFPPNSKTRWRCFGEEVWSGKKVEETHAVSFKVDGHGCALFVFTCNFNLRGRDVRMLSRVLLASFLGIVAILTIGNVARFCLTSRRTRKK